MNLINGCYGYGYSGIPTNLIVKELVFNYLGSLDIDSYLTNTIIKAAEDATDRANAAAELAENTDVAQFQEDLLTQSLDTGIAATAKFGGVERMQSDVNAETVSIEDFGASTSNVDNTTQINNANAYALSVGASVKYPNGDFTALGNIPNLHKVQAYGKGVIVRGDNRFYIEPSDSQKNIIYIKPNGNGDGLSKDNAMGISQIVEALRNICSRAQLGSWQIFMCAGNYTEKGIRFTDVPSFNKKLEIFGELDFTGAHATIWDGTLSTEPFAFRFDLRSVGLRLHFKDIKFINWNAEAGNAGAILGWGKHELITENIWVKDSQIGIWTARNCVHRTWGDKLENCTTWGIACQYNSSVIVGLSDKRTKVINCTRGIHIGRTSIGHLDYVEVEGGEYCTYVTQNSRITHINSSFKGWQKACHYLQNLGLMENPENATYDSASITDNTPVFYTENGAMIDAFAGKGSTVLHQNFVPAIPYIVTGTALTQLNLATGFDVWTRFPKFLLYQNANLDIRLTARVQGNNTTTGGYYSVCADGAEKELLRIPLPAGGYDGIVDVHVEPRSGGSTMYVWGTLTTSAGVTYVSKTVATTGIKDKTKNNTAWRIYLKMASATDSFTYISQKTWITY